MYVNKILIIIIIIDDEDKSIENVQQDKQEIMECVEAELEEEKNKNIVKWQVDPVFKRNQERLKIPADPQDWDVLHVRHWVQWAVRQFNLPNIKLSDWSMTGQDLYTLTLEDFQKICPNDPGDVFWTHLVLLRQMKVVGMRLFLSLCLSLCV